MCHLLRILSLMMLLWVACASDYREEPHPKWDSEKQIMFDCFNEIYFDFVKILKLMAELKTRIFTDEYALVYKCYCIKANFLTPDGKIQTANIPNMTETTQRCLDRVNSVSPLDTKALNIMQCLPTKQ